MGFFMRFFRKSECVIPLAALILWMLAAFVPVWAEGVKVTHATIYVSEEGQYLDADFSLDLTPVLEDALNRGVSLTFNISLEVLEPRWYWFNKVLIDFHQDRRLSFNPLTRTYRFSIGSLYLSFGTLEDALQALTHLNHMRLSEAARFSKGGHYEATLQMKLDVSQLPKPFQLDAISNSDWNLVSKPLSWTVKP